MRGLFYLFKNAIWLIKSDQLMPFNLLALR